MSFDSRLSETFTAPTNIAVIKYWGKNNVKLNTPMNSSLSISLDQKDLHTITTVAASKSFDCDRLWLNGKEFEINGRAQACLAEIRALANDRFDENTKELIVAKSDWPKYRVHISSVNTFPTGAGLASSAAGLACFVAALAKLYNVREAYPGQLSGIARQGSGSASRSMYGGFVKWQKGERLDGLDSIAIQVANEAHWPEMRAIVLVVSDKEKDTSSTYGMETSKNTSALLKFRSETVVPSRLQQIEEAILNKDFETFGRITMQDSNEFHAICLDTYPPIFYMNDISKAIIRLFSVVNENAGRVLAAYTFDAGPNAVIYTLEKDVKTVLAVVAKYFPIPDEVEDYCNDVSTFLECTTSKSLLSENLIKRLDRTGRISVAGDVKYVYLTKAGPGPVPQSREESLLNPNTGLPVAPGPKHKRMHIVTPKVKSTDVIVPTTTTSFTNSFLYWGLTFGLAIGIGYVFGRRIKI